MTEEERIAAAQQWIKDNLGQTKSIKNKYTHYDVKNIIEREIGYVSNDDVLTALKNLGYQTRPRKEGANDMYVNIPTQHITEWYNKQDVGLMV